MIMIDLDCCWYRDDAQIIRPLPTTIEVPEHEVTPLGPGHVPVTEPFITWNGTRTHLLGIDMKFTVAYPQD